MTQSEALAILKLGVNVFLTGEPGSGKTYVVNEYIRWLREHGISPSVTASTGIAATHINGMTIHSWSGIGIKRDIDEWDLDAIAQKEKTARRIMNAKVLIIDEISMLDARTLENVDKVLRALRRKTLASSESFGGLQIVFVGDFFQLPPVSKGEQSQFAFASQAWKDANPVVCYLHEQHRQEDADFLEILTAMRKGRVEAKHRTKLNTRMGAQADSKTTVLHTHNDRADRFNEYSLSKLKGNSKIFEMSSRGAKKMIEGLKNNCLSPERLILREGAVVMFTRNNFDSGYVNGTMGEVRGFSSAGLPMVRLRNGEKIEVNYQEWVVQDGNKILASISQIPLRLAWAITIHKSQGMSLDSAVIDLSRAFEYGQGYVALSRVRTLQGLFLEGMHNNALLVDPVVSMADEQFVARSDAAQKRIMQIGDKEREEMSKKFLSHIGGKLETVYADAEDELPESKSEKEKKEKTPYKIKLEKLREKHSNAYQPWTKEDDVKLEEMFHSGIKLKQLQDMFGRQRGSIESRLVKLGLMENRWVKRRNEEVPDADVY